MPSSPGGASRARAWTGGALALAALLAWLPGSPLEPVGWQHPALRLVTAGLGAAWLARALGVGPRGATLAGLAFAGSSVVLAHLDADMARFTAHATTRRAVPDFGLVELGALLIAAGVVWRLRYELASRAGAARWFPAASAGVLLAAALVLARWTGEAGSPLAPVHPARAAGWGATLALALALASLCTPDAGGLRARRALELVAIVGWVLAPHVDAAWVAGAGALGVALLAGHGFEAASWPARLTASTALAGLAFAVLAHPVSIVDWLERAPPDPPDGIVSVSERPPREIEGGLHALALCTHPGLPVATVALQLEDWVGEVLGARIDVPAATEANRTRDDLENGLVVCGIEGARVWTRDDLDLDRLEQGHYQLRALFVDEEGEVLGDRVVWIGTVWLPRRDRRVPLALLAASLALCALVPRLGRRTAWVLVLALVAAEGIWSAAGLPLS